GGALIGAGSGAVFKGTTGIVLEASPPESRVAMTSDLLIALYVGLSVPVIGAGVALDLGASAPNTVLGFAILVGLGVVVSGWALLGRRQVRPYPKGETRCRPILASAWQSLSAPGESSAGLPRRPWQAPGTRWSGSTATSRD